MFCRVVIEINAYNIVSVIVLAISVLSGGRAGRLLHCSLHYPYWERRLKYSLCVITPCICDSFRESLPRFG